MSSDDKLPEIEFRGGDSIPREKQLSVQMGPFTVTSTGTDAISFSSRRFHFTGNPVDAINALITAINAGRYPPVEILLWLKDAFETWQTDRAAGMDKAMRLSRPRGKNSAVEEYLFSFRDHILFCDMDMLIELGASREEAAEIACDRFNSDRMLFEQLVPGVMAPDVASVVRAYGRSSTAARQKTYWHANTVADPQLAKEFLARFPTTYMRSALKSRLSK